MNSITSKAENLGSIETPSDWFTYELNGAFTISIPPKMELRHDYDQYTQYLQNNNLSISNADAVFQQVGLADMTSEGYNTYSRVMRPNMSPWTLRLEARHQTPTRLQTQQYRRSASKPIIS